MGQVAFFDGTAQLGFAPQVSSRDLLRKNNANSCPFPESSRVPSVFRRYCQFSANDYSEV